MKTMQAEISGSESKKLDSRDDLELWLLGTEAIPEFNAFVLKVYNQAFTHGPAGTDGSYQIPAADIELPTVEYFHRARVCGVRHTSGQLIGTWGLILKDMDDPGFLLPIEKRYGIATAKILEKMNAPEAKYVFNGWRTAVDKDALEKFHIDRTKSIFVFDFLLRGLTLGFSDDPARYIGAAEMEMLVLKYHRRVGIPWQIIGEPVHFWNRDRYPCAFRMGEYKEYMRMHHPERFAFLYG
jgi:hypothetical protein